METATAPSWLVRWPRARRGPARLRLFCFPFSGAGASLYAGWQAQLPRGVEVVAVNLPGREGSLAAEPLTSLEPVLAGLCAQIEPELDLPYALFGHSIGAALAFELAREAVKRGWPLPTTLFVSSRRAPQLKLARRYQESEQALLDEILSWGGVPDELQDEELLELVLPALHADIVLNESLGYVPAPPLACPIVAFACRDDHISVDAVEPWATQTTGGFELKLVEGDHFTIREQPQRWLEDVATHLGDPGDPSGNPGDRGKSGAEQ